MHTPDLISCRSLSPVKWNIHHSLMWWCQWEQALLQPLHDTVATEPCMGREYRGKAAGWWVQQAIVSFVFTKVSQTENVWDIVCRLIHEADSQRVIKYLDRSPLKKLKSQPFSAGHCVAVGSGDCLITVTVMEFLGWGGPDQRPLQTWNTTGEVSP